MSWTKHVAVVAYDKGSWWEATAKDLYGNLHSAIHRKRRGAIHFACEAAYLAWRARQVKDAAE